jgi:hypothetical protein
MRGGDGDRGLVGLSREVGLVEVGWACIGGSFFTRVGLRTLYIVLDKGL